MDSLHHKDLILPYMELPCLLRAIAGDKIKDRRFYRFPIDQIGKLLLQKGKIQCFDAVKIRLSLCIQRSIFPVHKIVIHRKGDRVESVDRKLNG